MTTVSPFSLERPMFVLDSYSKDEHDETDVYGVDHHFSYSSGRIEEPYSYSMGAVEMRVGGRLNNPSDSVTTVQYRASISFPSIREASLEGQFTSEIEPEYHELETIAGGLIRILANKKVDTVNVRNSG